MLASRRHRASGLATERMPEFTLCVQTVHDHFTITSWGVPLQPTLENRRALESTAGTRDREGSERTVMSESLPAQALPIDAPVRLPQRLGEEYPSECARHCRRALGERKIGFQ